MRLDFPAARQNESFARLVISAFVLPLNPTLEELADIKTAVCEAVTNAIVHGYGGEPGHRAHARDPLCRRHAAGERHRQRARH